MNRHLDPAWKKVAFGLQCTFVGLLVPLATFPCCCAAFMGSPETFWSVWIGLGMIVYLPGLMVVLAVPDSLARGYQVASIVSLILDLALWLFWGNIDPTPTTDMSYLLALTLPLSLAFFLWLHLASCVLVLRRILRCLGEVGLERWCNVYLFLVTACASVWTASTVAVWLAESPFEVGEVFREAKWLTSLRMGVLGCGTVGSLQGHLILLHRTWLRISEVDNILELRRH